MSLGSENGVFLVSLNHLPALGLINFFNVTMPMFLLLFNQSYFYYIDFSSSGSGAASYTGLCFVILLSSRFCCLLLSYYLIKMYQLSLEFFF